MSNFTIDNLMLKLKSNAKHEYFRIGLLSASVFLLVFASFTLHVVAQQHTDNNIDLTLRSSGRVNPSTLGLEIDIPLGKYPGRGIDIPVTLSYSSKVWRTEFINSQSRINNPSSCIQISTPEFADRSAAGWTSSLAVPFIEYTGEFNLFNEKGHALSEGCYENGSGSPQLDNAYVKRITVHLPSGESHELRKDDTVVTYPTDTPLPSFDFNGTFYATDGSNIRYIEDSVSGSFKLQMPDGSFYEFANERVPLSENDTQPVRRATKFEDRNGNTTSYNTAAGTLTDTLGRVLASPIGPAPPASPTAASNPQIYNLPGINGGAITYKFHWKRLNGGSQAESALTDISDPQYQIRYMADRPSPNPAGSPRTGGSYLFGSLWDSWLHDSGEPLFNPVVLTEIEFPTGARYKFSYDIYGRIERIRYPAGGEERFEYQQIAGLTATSADDISNQTNFGVVSRKVYADPQTSTSYDWTYSAVHVPPAGYKVTTVTPENIKSERLLHRGNDPEIGASHGRFGYDNALTGMAYEQRVYDSNNALVSRTKTQWAKTELTIQNAPGVTQLADWHPRIKQSESFIYDTTSGQGLRAVSIFGYDRESDLGSISMPVMRNRTDEYGYENAGNANSAAQFGESPSTFPQPVDPPQAAALERSSEVTYLINDPSLPESTKANYRNRNLIGLTTSSELRDAAGIVYSRGETVYDQPGASSSIGRGNTTEVRKWDSTKGPSTDPNAYIFVRKAYDQYGNSIATTDANGNVSTREYDSAHNAFPIKLTTPVADPDGSNGSYLPFEQVSTFDFSTGLLLSTVNDNGLETRFEFEPQTLRLRRTSQFKSNTAVGAPSEIEYNDTANSTWIKTRKKIDENNWQETISHFDGLGRTIRSEYVHSHGNIVSDTEFDSEGRVSRVSAPRRVGETPRWTSNEYDSQGRVKRVTGPDGTSVITNSGVLVSDRMGTAKTVTDQAGRQRTGVVDALGRMIRVIEDPEGQALKTDYKFDIDSRIRETIQGDQHRYFNFDSLGRLSHSKQPEQDPNPGITATDAVTGNSDWAYKFEYDSNGNVIKTTNPRNIEIQAEYDALNRLTVREFSDNTPGVNYNYDGTGLPAAPSGSNGKLTRVSSSVSDTRITAFDQIGRVISHEQRTGDQTFPTSYEYSLSGQLIAETYPSQRRVAYDRTVDGELDSVKGSKLGQTSSTVYLSDLDRNSSGQVTGFRLGNGRWGLAEYSERDQLVRTGVGYSQGDTGVLNLAFDYGGSANNGSLMSQKIGYNGLPGEIFQSYSYDSLNRLKSSTESVAAAVNWRETFQYDRYGNREFDAGNTTTITQSNKVTNPAIDSDSNRMERFQDNDSAVDYGYDKAGNLVLDAENKRFVYDAENRIASFYKGTNTSNNPDAVYKYDGEGRRVLKQNNGNETVFVYNAFGKLIAEYSDKLPETPQIGYLTKDHLGSTRVVTDGSGTVVSRNDFMAFGEDLTGKLGNISGRVASHGYGVTSDIRKQYTGYERDNESGLDFAQARFYDAARARFTSVDPLTASANLRNPQTFNRYSYVLNSPHKFVDPLGLISQSTGACAQFCSNVVGGGYNGGTEDDVLLRFRAPQLERKKAADQTDDDATPDESKKKQIIPPQSLIAEATNRFVSVVLSGGELDGVEGYLVMTQEMSDLLMEALTDAFTRGVEVGSTAQAVSGVTAVTGMTESASAEMGGGGGGGSSGIEISVTGGRGKGVSVQTESLAMKAVDADVVARSENVSAALGVAGQLQSGSYEVATAYGPVNATASYGFFNEAVTQEVNLIYTRGIAMGRAATSGPGVVDKTKVISK